ncbi:hypothetical protein [Novosphingobium sp. P6W]|uniref:hypothetical protein n=1 Tax=Novosphingobium sp. P6W TaxID=1609758 RepID=UPI0005C3252F|nr:hypothetical protein [Novosphingobium sp. P6W]KIS29394.1 hypothetical protein TQ38_28695 [Novosphingobium sp. P6W]
MNRTVRPHIPSVRCRYPRPCVCLVPALTLAKELTRLCQEKGLQPEWQPLLTDRDRLQEATIEKDGNVITTRTHVSGQVGNVFKATGIALPANISELPPRTRASASSTDPKNVVVTLAPLRACH